MKPNKGSSGQSLTKVFVEINMRPSLYWHGIARIRLRYLVLLLTDYVHIYIYMYSVKQKQQKQTAGGHIR